MNILGWSWVVAVVANTLGALLRGLRDADLLFFAVLGGGGLP